MRNGNANNLLKLVNQSTTFYPTYEEWKLVIHEDTQEVISFPFYPTYEEWKHFNDAFGINIVVAFLSYLWGMETRYALYFAPGWIFTFYPTYEEWKVVEGMETCVTVGSLLIIHDFLFFL